MIDMTPYAFHNAQSYYLVANTPMFIVRKFRNDASIVKFAQKFSKGELLAELQARLAAPPKNPRDRVIPIVLIVALSMKNDRKILREALDLPADNYRWFKPVGESLLSSIQPVNHSEMSASNSFVVWTPSASISKTSTTPPQVIAL